MNKRTMCIKNQIDKYSFILLIISGLLLFYIGYINLPFVGYKLYAMIPALLIVFGIGKFILDYVEV